MNKYGTCSCNMINCLIPLLTHLNFMLFFCFPIEIDGCANECDICLLIFGDFPLQLQADDSIGGGMTLSDA